MKEKNAFFIGLALFAMFFGSGNLIYPLYVGQVAGDQGLLASLGFFLTGVAVPFLGVIAMLLFKGDYTKFFNFLGPKAGALFTVVLLTIWAPLGCCARCATLANVSFESFLPGCPLWLFSLLYSLLVYFIIRNKGHMFTILGYFLTPLLLVCLSLIIYNGGSLESAFAAPRVDGLPHFYLGLIEGYNTIDLVAAFFFSASIIQLLKKDIVKTTVKSCLLGVALLGIIYVCLIGMAGVHANMLAPIPIDQRLAYLSIQLLGPKLGSIALLAIFLACLTTSVAQITVYAEFLEKKVKNPNIAKVIALTITYVMSLTGLEGISAVTVPLLKVLYPLLVLMILGHLSVFCFNRLKDRQQSLSRQS